MNYYHMPNKSKPPHLGLMCKVLAYSQPGGALLGSGWIIYRNDGNVMAPELFDLAGEKLPEGWYHLQITQESKCVVIPRMVQ
jgi:hypothetical protein